MIGFLAVFLAAAVATAVTTPLVIRLAHRLGAVDRPADPRKVHREPVPTLGGIGMLFGFLAALGMAAAIPQFRDVFESTSEPIGLLVGVLVIATVGVIDDLRGLPPTVKLAGQIVGALAPVLFGIQIVYAWVPGLDVIALAPDLGMPLTILAMLAMINAVNLIDGLDGLAAGVCAIAAVAFFAFSMTAEARGIAEAVPTAAPIAAAAVAGMCVGFLVHNWHPAKIFMGDTGSMMLGLLLASSGVAYVGRSTAPSYADFAGSIPLLVPALVLAIPFVDTLFAVARRAYRRQPITVADKGHLHHLLIAFGHSHRRAVLTMYYWSALLAAGAIAVSVVSVEQVIVWGSAAVLVGVAITLTGMRRAADEAEPAVPGERRRIG
ncbi:MAG: undecaprenyl/decaprenyl-phosphate alpha-N-acetylglucosaminyl 1-phosphate transferase [Actinobacteria bacterium]|nr:undecaprenyl/decaprenyl-phosphate alpha-N-acetylglucosaminyl 1-phosphate transferase [Actinomycetota bacterium]